MKKFLGYLMIILFMAGSICGIVFGIMYKVTNDKYQELNSQDTQAYITQLETTIDNLTMQIEDLQGNIVELELQLDSRDEQIASDAETIAGLQETISELQSTIEGLNTTISSLQEEITQLQTDLEDSEDLAAEYANTISAFESQVSTLQNTISTLEDTITYYEELVASYNFEDKNIITFKVNNKNYDVIVTDSDSAFDQYVEDPKLIGYNFTGWSIDGSTPIELQGYSFTEDTTLYALFEETAETYNINSLITADLSASNGMNSNYVLNSYMTITGSNVSNIEIQTYSLVDFKTAYMLNISEPLIDFATVENNVVTITIPTSFIETNYSSLFKVDTENYLKLEYTFADGVMTMTDFWYMDNLNIDPETYSVEITSEEVDYITTLNSNVYTLVRTDMFNRELWTATLSEIDGVITLTYNDEKTFTFEKSNSNIYYLNETYNDILFYFAFGINSDGTIDLLSWDSVNGGGLKVEVVE